MTWHFTTEEEQIDVYDHTGTLVRENVSLPGSWSDIPEPVYDCMAEAAREAAARGDLRYGAEVFADAIADDIEEGQP
jgi:hypothetical protein